MKPQHQPEAKGFVDKLSIVAVRLDDPPHGTDAFDLLEKLFFEVALVSVRR
jgi:hypothetical protein